MTKRTLTATQVVEKLVSNWRGFPNTTALGRYEFLTQIISANSVEMKHIFELGNNPLNPDLIRRIHGVFIHELTHWLDHTSTVWGQSNLITIFNAFNAFENQKEEELWRVIKLFAETGRVFFADYYTVDGPGANLAWNRKPWKYQYFCGLQYGSDGKIRENYPFFATCFMNSDDVFINRVPMSVTSLLETNGVAAELELDRSIVIPVLQNKIGEDEFLVESQLLNNTYLERIYNSSLTVYSVATHCLANHAGISEIFTAYDLSSALSTLCLNLPCQVFDALQVPADIQEDLGERASHMIALRDRGFAFYLLAIHSSRKNHSDTLGWLESTVQSAGLPSIAELEELASQEINNLEQQILEGPESTHLKEILQIGKENFRKRGIYGNHKLCLNSVCFADKSLKLPAILLGDNQVFDVETTNQIPPRPYQEIEDWAFHIWDLESRLREFQRACLA